MSGLPQSSYMNALSQGPQMNVRRNIISGPGSGEYWNHSPGLERPLVREEGPWPIQGNIGSLLTQESRNYERCANNLPSIGGGPNCTAQEAFNSDIYTASNTCGANCVLSYPESFGDKDFGLDRTKFTNAHALHAYTNVRAATEGSGPSSEYGCYEWIPKLGTTAGDSCTIDQYPAYQQVGDWTKLKENQSLVNYTFRM